MNISFLLQNATSVSGEIDEVYQRLALALQERTDYLKNSVEKYLATEMKNLTDLKNNLDFELKNIQVNIINFSIQIQYFISKILNHCLKLN